MLLTKTTTVPCTLGFAHVQISAEGFVERVANFKRAAVHDIATQGELIAGNIACYDAFFGQRKFRCPLGIQYAKASKSGLPSINPIVDLLIATEMRFGLLAGIQDAEPIRGNLAFEEILEKDGYIGMRGEITCPRGDLVFRDENGIIASLFQGPDQRTKISPRTQAVVILVMGVPGIDIGIIENALREIVCILSASPDPAAGSYQILR